MKTRSLAPGAYLARSGQGVSLYDADGKCFAMNKMGGSILALALTGLSAEGIARCVASLFQRDSHPVPRRGGGMARRNGSERFPEFLAVGHRHCCPMSAIAQKYGRIFGD